jgi:hypothetical protein
VMILQIIAHAWCDLVALLLTVLLVEMIQHARGIGAEKITDPFLGWIAVSRFAASAVFVLISKRIKIRPAGQ